MGWTVSCTAVYSDVRLSQKYSRRLLQESWSAVFLSVNFQIYRA